MRKQREYDLILPMLVSTQRALFGIKSWRQFELAVEKLFKLFYFIRVAVHLQDLLCSFASLQKSIASVRELNSCSVL